MEPGMNSSMPLAPKGRRFASDVIDLVVVPVLLGFLLGLLFGGMREGVLKNIILLAFNVSWIIVRDLVYSPGRALIGLKLVGPGGQKPDIKQVFIRNGLILVPFVLFSGYICEFSRVFIPSLTGRRIAYAVNALLVILLGVMSTFSIFILLVVLAMLAVPVFFMVQDKQPTTDGNRFMDAFAGTRVVQQ